MFMGKLNFKAAFTSRGSKTSFDKFRDGYYSSDLTTCPESETYIDVKLSGESKNRI